MLYGTEEVQYKYISVKQMKKLVGKRAGDLFGDLLVLSLKSKY